MNQTCKAFRTVPGTLQVLNNMPDIIIVIMPLSFIW